ncbi:tetratricopeptide repeat-containing sensor histidine kinase [Gynurincola endophyticus]|uniref:tetratricopeptide repeat-containing sensor histidine kinase n=1 Tax=Gynurincola endophyticus TaxID=2479004 RepID=UPI000F8D4BCD|nr:sensor histidine kinase [Gynurincola endophyticus]
MNTGFFNKLFFLSGSLLLFWVPVTSQNTASDTAEVYRLLALGDEKNTANQPDSAESYYQKAGELADNLKFYNGFFEYTAKYTLFLYRQSRYQDALDISKVQYDVATRNGNVKKRGNALNNMAVQYQAMGNRREAATSLLEALDIAVSLNDIVNEHKCNTNLGSLFIDMKDYKRGLLYAGRSYELAVKMNDSMVIGRSLVNLLVAETYSGNLEKAMEYANIVLLIGEKYKNIDLILTAYCNLGDLHLRMHHYEEGLAMFKKAVPLFKDSPPEYEPYVLQGLASAYKHLGKFKEADFYFDKAFPLAKELFPQTELSQLLLSGADIKEAVGNYKAASELRKEFQILKDTLWSQNNQRTIHELEIQYQTAKKEASIAENEMKIAVQQNQLNRRMQWIIATSLVTLLLVTLLIFNYKVNLQKQRATAANHKNKLLEAQLSGEEEERSRTARELHDGVASVLSAAKLQLNISGEKNSLHKDANGHHLQELIELALQEVRNISHNLAAEVVLSDGLSYAVSEFCNRVSNEKLHIEYYKIGNIPEIKKNDQLLIYRIIQEAVTNIAKHAEASEAIVQLQAEENKLIITIEDNGKGFDMNHLPGSAGIGLRSLASRVQLLNGKYEIQSAADKGTSIFMEFEFQPLHEQPINTLDVSYS